MIFQL